MKVLFKNEEKNLLGDEIKVGDTLPEFSVTSRSLEDILSTNFSGVRIITTFPSVDTSVCSLQLARFNEEAKKHKNISVITVSLDLPFALDRFCVAKGYKDALVFSDYKHREFGLKTGLLIDGYMLLARSVLVVDANNKVVYKEICHNTSNEPNYEKALEIALKL